MFFSICYQFWAFKNPIFSTDFYSGVWWLLSPPLDSPFSPPYHLYFFSPPSLLNPILWISVGVLGYGEHLGNRLLRRSVSLLLSPPFFSSFSSLSPSFLSSSSCNSVNLSGCPSLWRIFSPLTEKFYYQWYIVGEVLRLLEE